MTREDLISLAKGAGIAAAGAALTYVSAYLTHADFGAYTPLIVAGFGILVNVLRKYGVALGRKKPE